MKKLTIDRNTWLRGDSKSSALLRAEDGKMCCLGFCAVQSGIPADGIADLGRPDDVDTEFYELWPTGLICVDEDADDEYSLSDVAERLIAENDSFYTPDSEREQRIASLFSSIGIEVQFIN